MFANVSEVELSTGEKVKCSDLTYGFVLGTETGEIEETKHAVIENGTDLTQDMVMNLRVTDVTMLYSKIIQLTYPDLFDKDGNPKELTDEQEDELGKKKV